jgi:hypothetical protein
MNRLTIAVLVLSPVLVTGCGGGDRNQWEIVLENKSSQSCSVTVSFGVAGGKTGGGGASVDGIMKGQTIPLVTGLGSTVVDSIKVKIGNMEKTLTPNAALPAGRRFKITVAEDRTIAASLVDN